MYDARFRHTRNGLGRLMSAHFSMIYAKGPKRISAITFLYTGKTIVLTPILSATLETIWNPAKQNCRMSNASSSFIF